MHSAVVGKVAAGSFFFERGWVTWDTYVWLCFAGLSAGFIDSVAGGGGMITVPALMYSGLPVHLALGTNKLQSSFGTMVAVMRYWKAGLISKEQIRHAMVWTVIAAAVGAWCVGTLGDEMLRRSVPILLITVAAYMVASPYLPSQGSSRASIVGEEPRRETDVASTARLSAKGFGLLVGGALGFYDGFFGPGAGAFWTVAWMSLQGLDLMRATAATKAVNLASNVASLAVFVCVGQVRWDCAAVMVAGQLVGARLGSGLAVKKGASLIRPMFTLVVITLAVRLLMR